MSINTVLHPIHQPIRVTLKQTMSDKKRGLQKSFDTVAPGYDHPALSFFAQTAVHMVQRLQGDLGIARRSRLLDACCGTGVVALEVAAMYPDCEVTGIDLSTGMLARAQSKADQAQLRNTRFLAMDLDTLGHPELTSGPTPTPGFNIPFDIACCSFGLFFLDDMQQGLINIARHVKPGGKIAISSFAEGAFEPMSQSFAARYQALGHELPPLSWKQMTTDEQLYQLYAGAGIDHVEIQRLALGFHMHSAADWWDVVWNAGYRGLLLGMGESELEQFKREHLREVQQLCDTGQSWLDTGVVIAIGQRC